MPTNIRYLPETTKLLTNYFKKSTKYLPNRTVSFPKFYQIDGAGHFVVGLETVLGTAEEGANFAEGACFFFVALEALF